MNSTCENPADAGTSSGVETDLFSYAERRRNYTRQTQPATGTSADHDRVPADNVTSIRALIGDGAHSFERVFRGRVARMLNELVAAGETGVTPIERPAPRYSDYCFKLRKAGLNVETITEAHGGPYSGNHARYVLRTPVSVIETNLPSDGGAHG